MGWYRFEDNDSLGIFNVKEYQVAWYEDGICFDEDWYGPDQISDVVPYVETEEDKNNIDHSRVFVIFENGDKYEIKLEKVNEE